MLKLANKSVKMFITTIVHMLKKVRNKEQFFKRNGAPRYINYNIQDEKYTDWNLQKIRRCCGKDCKTGKFEDIAIGTIQNKT